MSESDDKWMTLAEVAIKIRMTQDYVRRQCVRGRLRATKLGNRWRIERASVEEFMAGEIPAARERDTSRTARQQREAS
jgi:excisionase family DNA binding protein